MMSENESVGRIEVAPEVLATIAHYAALRVDGVSKMATIPADAARLFRRATRHNGVVLHLVEDKVTFDIYVIMNPDVNIMEASQKLQTAVLEAINTMVGIPVTGVNIHVEDVVYAQGEAN
ncbi:MAG: Asp23/Gls24 family envelope stress response protein [Chloroflexi bacterium]|nr:MAG: Asp23/Gls24 family envelope stress response protein [Chloroflexota bacterium]